MNIQLNGDTVEIAYDKSILALLQDYLLTDKRVLVAVNQQIIPKSLYAEHYLSSGDSVFIIHAIGGS